MLVDLSRLILSFGMHYGSQVSEKRVASLYLGYIAIFKVYALSSVISICCRIQYITIDVGP